MAINVGGLTSKLDYPSFIEFVATYDIIVVTESKFADTDTINIDGFTPFYKNRSKYRHKSGGIIVLIRNFLLPYVKIIENIKMESKIFENHDKYTFVNYDISSRALFFTVDEQILGHKVLFCGNYIEGDNSVYFNRHEYDELSENILNINCNNVCLLGDLNSRTRNMDDFISKNIYSSIYVFGL